MISGDLCAVLTQFLAKPTRALNLYIIQLNRFLYTTHCTSLQVCFSWAVLDYCPEQGLEYKSQSNGLKPSLAICHGLHLQITSNRKVTVFEDSRHWKWGSSPCLKSQVFGARRSSARSPGGFLQDLTRGSKSHGTMLNEVLKSGITESLRAELGWVNNYESRCHYVRYQLWLRVLNHSSASEKDLRDLVSSEGESDNKQISNITNITNKGAS